MGTNIYVMKLKGGGGINDLSGPKSKEREVDTPEFFFLFFFLFTVLGAGGGEKARRSGKNTIRIKGQDSKPRYSRLDLYKSLCSSLIFS